MVIIDLEANFQMALKKYKEPNKNIRRIANTNSFQQSMAFPLTVLQFLWIFPLSGIRGNSSEGLRIQFLSWKMFYGFICGFMHVENLVHYYVYMFHPGCPIHANIIAIHLDVFIEVLYFFYLTRSWPNIVKEWENIEHTMRYYEGPDMNLKRTLNLITIISLIALAIEYRAVAIPIPQSTENIAGFNLIALIIHKVWNTFCHQFLLVRTMFIWFFKDILIVIISICIIKRLNQIKRRILFLIRMRVDNIDLWQKTREDYAKLLRLCQTINCKFSCLFIMSYIFNITYLLINGFQVLSVTNLHIQFKVLQLFRISSILMRLFLVCHFGGKVYDENGEIVDLLSSVSSDIYNLEIRRFLCHAASGDMVLTGKNFFSITKPLILNIANAVVTYELVIMQFVQNFRQLE